MPHERQRFGSEGERAAEAFLRRERFVILARNYRCRLGEVDLVALDGKTLVFVEVKARRGPSAGSAFEAVDERKQRRIARAAEHFVVTHRLENRNTRFDVVAVWREGERISCELIKGAFELEG